MENGRIEFEIIVQDFRGKKQSIGKYQSDIKNYTLCVDVEKYDLSHIIAIHIEFKGKVNP